VTVNTFYRSVYIDDSLLCCFFFNATPTPKIYTLSLHDALPIYSCIEGRKTPKDKKKKGRGNATKANKGTSESGPSQDSQGEKPRSEEHTSELQSRFDLVCRLLLEKKKK